MDRKDMKMIHHIITKAFEIRDRATFIPVLATKLLGTNEGNRYLLRRAGFGQDYPLIAVTHLERFQSEYDPYKWNEFSRTIFEAHKYIQEHFDDLNDGDVVDVEYILGEVKEPKKSERYLY
jgi:hypothetical protein